LQFYLCFEDNGRSFDHLIKLKDLGEFNKFIISDYKDALSEVNFHINEMKRYNGCELTKIRVKLVRYGFMEFLPPI
jgi:hypothetical protein